MVRKIDDISGAVIAREGEALLRIPIEDAATFAASTARRIRLSEDMVMIKYVSPDFPGSSNYLTFEVFDSVEEIRSGLALPRHNTATEARFVVVPAGTEIVVGRAKSRVGVTDAYGPDFPVEELRGESVFGNWATGGAMQVFVPDEYIDDIIIP